jgi:hypothetical protein
MSAHALVTPQAASLALLMMVEPLMPTAVFEGHW